jgi:hypothetical protein
MTNLMGNPAEISKHYQSSHPEMTPLAQELISFLVYLPFKGKHLPPSSLKIHGSLTDCLKEKCHCLSDDEPFHLQPEKQGHDESCEESHL